MCLFSSFAFAVDNFFPMSPSARVSQYRDAFTDRGAEQAVSGRVPMSGNLTYLQRPLRKGVVWSVVLLNCLIEVNIPEMFSQSQRAF